MATAKNPPKRPSRSLRLKMSQGNGVSDAEITYRPDAIESVRMGWAQDSAPVRVVVGGVRPPARHPKRVYFVVINEKTNVYKGYSKTKAEALYRKILRYVELPPGI